MPAKKKKRNNSSPVRSFFTTKVVIALVAGFILGIILFSIAIRTSGFVVEKEIKTYCDIDMQNLYGKPCTLHEECFGRLELCSVSLKKCVTTVQIDKNDPHNIRIPDSREECEANSGIWTIDVVNVGK